MISFRNCRNDNCDNGRNSNSGFMGRIQGIRQLDFASFQALVWLWLGSQGYGHFRSLGRKSQRGRRSIGGADFLAIAPGKDDLRVAIQIRHRQTRISRLAVDELRGFMLRYGIPIGLIVTNTEFQRSATKAVEGFPGRPIQLISAFGLAQALQSWESPVPESRNDCHGSQISLVLRHLHLASTDPNPSGMRRPQRLPFCPEPINSAIDSFGFCSDDDSRSARLVFFIVAIDLLALLILLEMFYRAWLRL